MLLQDVFINRKKELSTIPSGLRMGQSYILIAPRRYGKTTLMKKIAGIIADQNTIVVYVDIMRYANDLNNLTEAIVEACLNKIGFLGKIQNWVKSVNLKLDIKVKFHELEIDAIIEELKQKDNYTALAKAVDLPEKLSEKYNKRFIMFYDEFGELQHFNEHAVKVMRSMIQHHKHVSYLFAGSQESLMNKIFISNKGAFYRFGIIYQLAELETKDVIEFFHTNLTNVDTEVFEYIIENFKGHPYYTTNLFFRISQFAQAFPTAKFSLADLKTMITDLIFSESHYLSDQIKKLTSRRHELEVIIAVSDGNPYTTKSALTKQTVYACLKNLLKDGFLLKRNENYVLADPLLATYLKDESLSLI